MTGVLRTLPLLFTVLLLAACAAGPKFDTENIASNVTPQSVAQEGVGAGEVNVLWGGVIIASSNLEDTTQIEALAYPLDSEQRPDTSMAPMGRFLIIREGFLETTDYAQGRLVTVRGKLQGTRRGRVGEADYTYPVVSADQLHLWSRDNGGDTKTRFHFGIIFTN